MSKPLLVHVDEHTFTFQVMFDRLTGGPVLAGPGTSRRCASANASSDQGHQSTGFSACWSRYGLVAVARRLGMSPT